MSHIIFNDTDTIDTDTYAKEREAYVWTLIPKQLLPATTSNH